VLRVQERRLIINVCGRTIAFPESCNGVKALQDMLQGELGMPDQMFEVFDNTGERILVDMDLREAIAGGRIPLSATLSDASIHFIENRREELAQMQWKLVRDQNNQAVMKVGVIDRKVAETESKLDMYKRANEENMQGLRSELLAAIEVTKDIFRQDGRQFGERLAGISQLVQAERNMREVAIEQLHKSIQTIHDTIDSDRGVIQQSADIAMSHVDSSRKLIEAERATREALEDKLQRDVENLSGRLEEVQTSFRASIGEYSRRFEKASSDSSESIESHNRKTMKLRTDVDSTLGAQATRIKMLEDRNTTLEARLEEAQRRQNDAVERMSSRHEKVATHLETVKLNGSAHSQTMESLSKKMEELEASINAREDEYRDTTDRERRQRQEEFKGLKEAVRSDQERLRHSIEGTLSSRLQAESMNRQDAITGLLDSVRAKSSTSISVLSPAANCAAPSNRTSTPIRTARIVDMTSDEAQSEARQEAAPVRRLVGGPFQSGVSPGNSVSASTGNSLSMPVVNGPTVVAKGGTIYMSQASFGSTSPPAPYHTATGQAPCLTPMLSAAPTGQVSRASYSPPRTGCHTPSGQAYGSSSPPAPCLTPMLSAATTVNVVRRNAPCVVAPSQAPTTQSMQRTMSGPVVMASGRATPVPPIVQTTHVPVPSANVRR